MELMQSAYRKHHSTETLLAVQNDLLMAIDQKKAAVLVLLDLSAAFDTIDHNILLQHINTSALKLLFGVPQGSVLGRMTHRFISCSIKMIQ